MLETGFIYSTLIDPLLRNLRKRLAFEIQEGDTVIDIACGTGAQLFELTHKAKSATGIDLSESMVLFASQKAKRKNIANASFVACDATNLSIFYRQKFDVAILSMALHQFEDDLYQTILSEAKKVAHKFILLDYAVPLPNNSAGLVSKVAEFLAGKTHYRNFKRYTKTGGLNVILQTNGFSIQQSKLMGRGAFQLVVAENHSA